MHVSWFTRQKLWYSSVSSIPPAMWLYSYMSLPDKDFPLFLLTPYGKLESIRASQIQTPKATNYTILLKCWFHYDQQWEIEPIREKLTPVPLCLLCFLHDLIWQAYRSHAFNVRSHWLNHIKHSVEVNIHAPGQYIHWLSWNSMVPYLYLITGGIYAHDAWFIKKTWVLFEQKR
jgi:hypothetical protein